MYVTRHRTPPMGLRYSLAEVLQSGGYLQTGQADAHIQGIERDRPLKIGVNAHF